MKRRLDLEAPAKINLGLRVVGTRPDGYHLIESLFVPLDLVDDVEVEVCWPSGQRTEDSAPGVAGDIRIEVIPERVVPEAVGPQRAAAGKATPEEVDAGRGVPQVAVDRIPADDRNLAVVAARAFLAAMVAQSRLAASDCPAVNIVLRKRIPAAAGLGGGSSDAGTVLAALSRLIPEGPSGAELEAVALGVGADVPYFLDPRPALVTGVGESIAPMPGVPNLSLLLVNPGVAVATEEVYHLYDQLAGERAGSREPSPATLTPKDPGSTMPALSGPGAAGDAFSRLLDSPNDLEPASVCLCPEIARLRDRLLDLGAESAGMSGSGATVYGVFTSDSAAGEALEKASFEPPVWARVVRSESS